MDSTTVAPPTPPRLSQRIVTLVGDARELLCDHLELAALEARRAGAGLVRTLCAAVVISLLVVTAWLALVAAGIVWVTDAGVGWGGALAFAALANLLLAVAVAWWLRSQARDLLFAATLRHLRRTAGAGEGDTA
jgi:uncharacterized membrane protein YqjE